MACGIVSNSLPGSHVLNVYRSLQKRVFEKRVLMAVFGRKKEEVTGVWTELRKFIFAKDYCDNQIEENW